MFEEVLNTIKAPSSARGERLTKTYNHGVTGLCRCARY